jgi:hypothetical protein
MKQPATIKTLTFLISEKIDIINSERYFEFGIGDLPAAGQVVRMGKKRKAYRILVAKPERKFWDCAYFLP